jgi:hypothetical protein
MLSQDELTHLRWQLVAAISGGNFQPRHQKEFAFNYGFQQNMYIKCTYSESFWAITVFKYSKIVQ